MSRVPTVVMATVIAMATVIPVMLAGMGAGMVSGMVAGMMTGRMMMPTTVILFRVSRVSLTVSTPAKLWRMSSIVAVSVVGDSGMVAELTWVVDVSSAVGLRVRVCRARNEKCVKK